MTDAEALPAEFPDRALSMARLARLSFLGDPPHITGRDPVLRFPLPLGGAAATAIALCGDAVAEIWRRRTGERQRPRVDTRAAAAALAGFAFQVLSPNEEARAEDWEPEPAGWRAWGARAMLRGENASNPTVGLYRTRDGRWIHLHGGLPHLAERILRVLGTHGPSIPAAVGRWNGESLENALADADTCGAVVRGAEEWRLHPQGRLLRDRPVVEVLRVGDAPPQPLPAGVAPLGNLRVLDLSVALAGPTCARTLAQHGAEVLHVAAPDRLDRQPFQLETGHGKRSVWIDLRKDDGRATLAELTRGADVFCQSYRRGALSRLGFGQEQVAALRPGIIHVSINCYGHTGPWADRRGWEGLAQAATGLTLQPDAETRPRLAPGSVCDYLTGYLAARGVMEALLRRATEGGTWHVRASLCQTGMWLARMGTVDERAARDEPDLFEDLLVEMDTPLGRLRCLPPALRLDSTPPTWALPPPLTGSGAAAWASRH